MEKDYAAIEQAMQVNAISDSTYRILVSIPGLGLTMFLVYLVLIIVDAMLQGAGEEEEEGGDGGGEEGDGGGDAGDGGGEEEGRRLLLGDGADGQEMAAMWEQVDG